MSLEDENIRTKADLKAFVEAVVGDLPQKVTQLQSRLLEGDGSPENVVAAPVGTIYRRLDGGAGTVLYVKESGTGNSGWVSK